LRFFILSLYIVCIIMWYYFSNSAAGNGRKFDEYSFILFCSVAIFCSLFWKISNNWRQSDLLTISIGILFGATNKIAVQGLVGPLAAFTGVQKAPVKGFLAASLFIGTLLLLCSHASLLQDLWSDEINKSNRYILCILWQL
jgi:hypothetical protein